MKKKIYIELKNNKPNNVYAMYNLVKIYFSVIGACVVVTLQELHLNLLAPQRTLSANRKKRVDNNNLHENQVHFYCFSSICCRNVSLEINSRQISISLDEHV